MSASAHVESAVTTGNPDAWRVSRHQSQIPTESSRRGWRTLFFGAITVCLMLWVAAFNGYPTVYPDTGSYLYTAAFHVILPPYRAPIYAIFLEWASLGITAWFAVVSQAVLVTFVLFESCKFLIPGGARFRANCMLGIAVGLALFTSLPWAASQLMPDVFAGLVFLCAYLLAFNGRLVPIERIVLAAILALSVGAHMSLFPIAAAFVAALALVRLAGFRPQGAPSLKSMLAWLLVPILAAGLCTATLNRNMGLGFRLSVSGNEYLLGRLFSNGLAEAYLRDSCPQKGFVTCRYLGSLPRTPEAFLFWNPLLGELDANGVEVRELVRGTILAHPFRFLLSDIRDTLRQLVMFRTGDGIRETNAPNSNAEVIHQMFPRDSIAFLSDRQSLRRLNALTYLVVIIDSIAVWGSLFGCLYLAGTVGLRRLNQFFYAIMMFLFINAAICATLAGAYQRYQSRVVWLLPFCLLAYLCCLVQPRRSAAHVAAS